MSEKVQMHKKLNLTQKQKEEQRRNLTEGIESITKTNNSTIIMTMMMKRPNSKDVDFTMQDKTRTIKSTKEDT